MNRYSVYMDEDLHSKVKDLADKNNWSVSYAGFVLLQSAVKEKTRRRKNSKISDNSPDSCEGYAGRSDLLPNPSGEIVSFRLEETSKTRTI